jgi:squalene-associated FAD-dependent desaturase
VSAQAPPGTALAVVGAGWAGLAAAVRGVQQGCAVTLFEMAPHPGGRARSVAQQDREQDNGQHILVGAYRRCLDLMRTVGVEPGEVLARMPLSLVDAAGQGLRLPPGPPLASFALGVARHSRWTAGERIRLLAQALRWAAGGFAAVPDRPVAEWSASLPAAIRRELIEPLCVAALNTDADNASAAVFLRVLRDALFSGRGSADLLLPRQSLDDLLPGPAVGWLQRHGARVLAGRRVQSLARDAAGWSVDGQPFDGVVLACTAREAARLVAAVDERWVAVAAGFRYEPIITVTLQAPRVRSPFPMISLADGPAQFAFDLGRLNPAWEGRVTLVASGAARWVEAGRGDFDAAVRRQVDSQLREVLPDGGQVVSVITEKRATFQCTPGLVRPRQRVAPGLWAAGDYVEGPYPATLEGAVRSGEAAARQACETARARAAGRPS